VGVVYVFSVPCSSLCAVPAEHVVISKERRSGSYHLSAYYLAKTVSELPLVLLLPLVFLTISYWAAAINSWASYFALLLIVTVSNLAGQASGCGSDWRDVRRFGH